MIERLTTRTPLATSLTVTPLYGGGHAVRAAYNETTGVFAVVLPTSSAPRGHFCPYNTVKLDVVIHYGTWQQYTDGIQSGAAHLFEHLAVRRLLKALKEVYPDWSEMERRRVLISACVSPTTMTFSLQVARDMCESELQALLYAIQLDRSNFNEEDLSKELALLGLEKLRTASHRKIYPTFEEEQFATGLAHELEYALKLCFPPDLASASEMLEQVNILAQRFIAAPVDVVVTRYADDQESDADMQELHKLSCTAAKIIVGDSQPTLNEDYWRNPISCSFVNNETIQRLNFGTADNPKNIQWRQISLYTMHQRGCIEVVRMSVIQAAVQRLVTAILRDAHELVYDVGESYWFPMFSKDSSTFIGVSSTFADAHDALKAIEILKRDWTASAENLYGDVARDMFVHGSNMLFGDLLRSLPTSMHGFDRQRAVLETIKVARDLISEEGADEIVSSLTNKNGIVLMLEDFMQNSRFFLAS
jgi:hypothetical protein